MSWPQHGLTLIPAWISITSITKCGVKLLIHSQTLMMQINFIPTLYWTSDYLHMQGIKYDHFNKMTPRLTLKISTIYHENTMKNRHIDFEFCYFLVLTELKNNLRCMFMLTCWYQYGCVLEMWTNSSSNEDFSRWSTDVFKTELITFMYLIIDRPELCYIIPLHL